jgi:hypothetical protein
MKKLGTVLILSLGLITCRSNGDNNKNHSNMNHGYMKHDSKSDMKGMDHMNQAAKVPTEFNSSAANGLMTMNTKNITRLNESDPFKLVVNISQTIWLATHKKNQLGAIILVPNGS